MKSIFLAFFLTICYFSYSQVQNLEGFLGIKFGSSREEVKKSMLLRQDCKLDIQNSNENVLFFDNVNFGGRKTEYIIFKFVNNQFHTGAVVLKPELESKCIELYTKIKDELNEKYFVTDKDYENYKYPYEKGDGHAETAIAVGKAEFVSYWFFNQDTDGEIQNAISIQIKEDFNIVITYQDGKLITEAIKKQKESNFKDY